MTIYQAGPNDVRKNPLVNFVRTFERTKLYDLLAASVAFFEKQLAGPQGAEARRYLAKRGLEAADEAVERLLEQRLAAVSVRTPAFAQALRAYRSAVASGDGAAADALAAWLGGQPHVAAAAKRSAGIRPCRPRQDTRRI